MAETVQRPRRHRIAVPALLVVGTLVAFLATFSVWVNRQALNTDKARQPLIAEPFPAASTAEGPPSPG